jgi:hypothetical protein
MNATAKVLANVFPGGSAMSAAMRSLDWSATPLGPPDDWSPALKTTVGFFCHQASRCSSLGGLVERGFITMPSLRSLGASTSQR